MCKSTALLLVLKIFGFLLVTPLVKAQNPVAANWCEEAEVSLTDKHGNAVHCNVVLKLRCVRMNNYWCQKHGRDPWRGTKKADGKDGNRDKDGHAIFESVSWSARAIAVDLRTKYRRGLVTAIDIATAYSPWCDTLGSKAIVHGYGRTCEDGRAKPPPSFTGPFCERPKKLAIEVSDCLTGCNCPPRIAQALVRSLVNININSDLKLFGASQRPLPNLTTVIRNLALQEQGIYVRDSVIKKGIKQL